MRILFYSAYPGFSGSHRMALQIARACRRAGHEVIAVAPADMEYVRRADAEGLPTAVMAAPNELLRFGKALLRRDPLGRLGLFLFKLLPYSLRARRFLKARGVDVVYAAEQRSVVQIGIAARLAGVPLMWHVQCGLPSGNWWIHRACGALSTALICVSDAIAGDVKEVLGEKVGKRLRVVRNGIPDVDPAPAGPQRTGQPVWILYAGNVVPEKGVHHLIRALSRVVGSGDDRVRLAIAGTALDDAYYGYVRSLASEPALAGRVEWLGYRDDVDRLIGSSDVVVCPSVERERLATPFGTWDVDWKEAFCLVALEAMRAAKPVVSSDSFGLREVVSQGETGVRVPPGDVAALAGAIRDLAADPDSRQRLGGNGRRRFEETFSLESMTGGFLRELEAVRPR